MQHDWRNIAYWSGRKKCAYFLLLFLLVFVIFSYVYAWPLYQDYQQTQFQVATIPSIQQKIKHKQRLIIELDKQQVLKKSVTWQRLNQLWKPITILSYLRQLSGRSGIQLMAIHGQIKTTKKIDCLLINLSMQSSYSQWVAWLLSLQKSPFAWQVLELHIKPLGDNGRLDISLQLLFVRLQSAWQLAHVSVGQVIVKKMVSPFVYGPTLNQFSHHQLKLLGVLLLHSHSLAVVSTNSGHVRWLSIKGLVCQKWVVDQIHQSMLLLMNRENRQIKQWRVGHVWQC